MAMARFANEEFRDVPGVKTKCGWGLPGDAILAQAQASQTNLIMMPVHGHTALGNLLIGSVTERVLHRAACAVWTGSHLDSAKSAEYFRVEKILCALDLEQESIHVIEATAELSDRLGAEVQILHCIPGAQAGPVRPCDTAFEQFLSDYAREQLNSIQKKAGTSWRVCLAAGAVSPGVREAALANGTDLTADRARSHRLRWLD